jgi:hypothetical protein
MIRIRACACAFVLLACCLPMVAQESAAASDNDPTAPPATITGHGTAGFFPVFTGVTTIGNSKIFQTVGLNIGIGITAPTAKLDVNGTGKVRDTLTLIPKLSHPTLSVNGTAFAVSNTGKVTFVAGQNFPGTARLVANNHFTGNQSITGNLSATGNVSSGGTVSGAAGSFTSLSAGTGTITGNLSVNGNFGTSGNGTFSGGLGVGGAFSVGAGQRETGSIQFTDDGTAGLQPPLVINAVDCCNFGNRMMWAHSPGFSQWGWYYDDAVDHVVLQRSLTAQVAFFDFGGSLTLNGTLTAAAKNFKIDHPLDPKNKYLSHTSVESSEMMNIYTGNAILDNSGEGVVSLPKWFEALNTDFRYQLTAIGAAAPNLHVAQEIANHQFSIAGGAPGMKVSWQVTGVRHDAYAKTHPLVVEARKPEKERGRYQNPDAYGAQILTQEQMLQRQSKP